MGVSRNIVELCEIRGELASCEETTDSNRLLVS